MDAKELANRLDGIEYPTRIPNELKTAAKAAGLVIVYGASDDLMYFDGTFNDEIGCYNGGVALVDARGVLPERDSIDDDDELERFFARRKTARRIEAIWNRDGYSWQYKTDIPHETFQVIDDGDTYCRGIVFSVEALKAAAP